ncbi:unnamed protein product [Caenorhabditis auriculariae]|uniref:PDZ domain-containing protein n=1 Tax=Caenorhabditis auriculariae TaxID=2777116 RepID=A0A8S1HV60_9PELO|nr:unnamed protein product [Caenorhabditis auriculariae]
MEEDVRAAPRGSAELEAEVVRLERQLQSERDERRKLIRSAQEEMELEVGESEQKWIARVRKAHEEKEEMGRRVEELEEQVDTLSRQLNRSDAYKMEVEEAHDRLRMQLDSLQHDYEETMQERSIVLEENTRLNEEKEKMQREVERVSSQFQQIVQHNELETEIERLAKKLEHTRRLLQVNMEETVSANARRDEAIENALKLQEECSRLTEERDDAFRKCRQAHRESIVDVWNTHSVQLSLPYPKPNLGVILAGGRTENGLTLHGPIYVKQVLPGSPFENMLRKMDHLMMVNDISVTEMDEKSVMGMLANCHHLHLVIRRRSNCNRVHDIELPLNYDVGLELANGVFINAVEANGAAKRAGLAPGQRVVHVMQTPVYDAKHAEQLIKNAREPLVIGVLQSTKRTENLNKDKQKATIFSKLFGRQPDKERNVVAKANIERNGDSSFLRQGSLRIPHSQTSPLVRYGSLRAPQAEHAKIVESLENPAKRALNRTSAHSETSSVWPPPLEEEDQLVPLPYSKPAYPIYSGPSSPPSRIIRQSSEQRAVTSPRQGSPWSRTFSPNGEPRPYSYQFGSLDGRPMSSSPLPTGYHPRITGYSPSPQPPPYSSAKGIRNNNYQAHVDDACQVLEGSLSSFLSSSNSLRHPSTSFSHYYTNNSICSASAENPRRICLSKEGSEFSLALENSNAGGVVIQSVQGKINGPVKRGDRLLDVGGINMRCADKDSASKVFNHFRASQDEVTLLVSGAATPRWMQVPRSAVRLCGGNAIGILSESSVGELLEGDLILEIDDYNVRRATLEDANEALHESTSESVHLLIQDGGDRLNRLRLGADGDSFFVRVNVDRGIENKDELELKAGEVVFVDKTLFMGQRGRWRAWKVDREGRQRENGVIPSADSLQNALRTNKRNRNSFPFTRNVYERVEKVNSSLRRPVILYGALTAPFMQALLDDSTKFVQIVPECRALTDSEVERLLSNGEIVDAKKRERLYDVVSTSSIHQAIEQSLHGILEASPATIQRLQNLRIFPIVVKIRFKNVKQIKEIKEELFAEKTSSKQAKELMEKAQKVELELESTGVVVTVSSYHNPRLLVKHVVSQTKQLIEDEQKRTVWVACQ